MDDTLWSQMNRTLLGLVFLLLMAGCTTPGSGGDVPTPTQTSASAGTETGAVPDEHKEVELLNEWNQTVDIRVRVVRLATNETVHDENYTLSPEARRTAYTIRRADTDGIESFRVAVTVGNETNGDRFTNDACYGDIRVPINSDGTFDGPLSGGIC